MPRDPAPQANGTDAATQALEIGARLVEGPSERLVRTAFAKELEDQLPLFEAMGLADLSHTLILLDAGIVPAAPGRELLAALLELQGRPADFVPDPARGDLYTNREAWLAGRTPAVGWLGAGRARREATTTAFHVKLREELLKLAQALTEAAGVLARRAREFGAALMPDYTYLQAAQPTSFGHYLLGFAFPLLRDLDRLRALYGRVNLSPAGCGSTNGSRLPQDRARLAELLGFEGLAGHARDAMWQADLPIETAAALTAILVNLDRLAEDLQIFSTGEFGLVELDDRHARASKIMPQKKNPFALTHVRGLANRMLGTLAASAAAGRTPSGQPDNRLAPYGSIPRAIADTRDAVELMAEVVERLRFDPARGRAGLAGGFAFATDLAEVLVLECGLDFRRAHRLVGRLVRRSLAAGEGLDRLTPATLAAAAEELLGQPIELPEPALRAALNPEAALAARTAPGGAAPEALAAMLDECEGSVAEAQAWAGEGRRRIHSAQDGLLRTVRQTIEG
jgi:argininosuccinate lyase